MPETDMNRRPGKRSSFPVPALIIVVFAFLTTCWAAGTCIASNGSREVRAGSEQDFRPYAFTDKDGRPTGFGVELLKAVADSMGLPIRFTSGSWDNVWSGLVAGRIDVLPVVARTPGRERLVDFSVPHTETFDAFFVREGRSAYPSLSAAAGREIVVLRSDAAHHELVGRKFAGIVVPVESIPEGLRLIAEGRHDAMLCSKLVGVLELGQAGIEGVMPGPPIPEYKRVFSFAVRKGDAELLEKLNQGLRIVKATGEYERIYERWLAVENPWRKWLPYFKWVTYGLVVLAASVITLQWLVRKRTRELNRAMDMLRDLNATLEQRVAERTAELRESEERLRLALDAARMTAWEYDPASNKVTFSENAGKVLELPRKPANGDQAYDLIHPDDRERHRTPVVKAIATGGGYESVYRLAYGDPAIWVEEHGRAVVDAAGKTVRLVGVSQNVTDRKRAEEAVRESESKYRNLFENMAEEVHFWQLVRDGAGNIETWRLVDANPPTLKSWGRSSVEGIRGKTTDEIFGPGATDHYMPVVRKIMADGVPYSFEDYFPHLDRHFRFTSVPLGEYFITTGADITAMKKAQEALRTSLSEKEILLRELSHRTKNNMQVIGSLLSLQISSSADGKLASVLEDTQGRIRAMALVHEKLYRTGNFASLNVKDYLTDLVSAILQIHLADVGHVRMESDLDDISISIDAALTLGLIVNELVSNSLKHAFPGGKSGEIFLSLKRHGEKTELRFRDDGPGLPPDFDLSRLGSLGLKLVQNLAVRQLRGTMEIRRGNITEFVFRFDSLSHMTGV
ncbi:MAG: transporter substrate-binding domain-containing protein [Thermodesulfobacteriota bacterium]